MFAQIALLLRPVTAFVQAKLAVPSPRLYAQKQHLGQAADARQLESLQQELNRRTLATRPYL